MEGRTGQALNLAGEKLPEGSVVAAVAAAAAAALPLGARTLREWAAREEVLAAGSGGDSSGHYTFYVECGEGPAAAETRLANGSADGSTEGNAEGSAEGALSSAQLAAFATALDAALLEAAPAYATVRGGMVAPLRVKLVAPGAFEGIRWVGCGWQAAEAVLASASRLLAMGCRISWGEMQQHARPLLPAGCTMSLLPLHSRWHGYLDG